MKVAEIRHFVFLFVRCKKKFEKLMRNKKILKKDKKINNFCFLKKS
jgi:hypothetical protein